MRRGRAQAISVNLDSLLDTLFNVVGMLIIILALVVLNVSESVSIIRFAEKQRATKQIESFYERYNELLSAEPVPGIEPLSETRVDLDALSERLTAMESRLTARREIIEEYERLAESLDKEIQRRSQNADRINQNTRTLRVPVMRDADPSKTAFTFVCINNRVYPLDMDKLSKQFEQLMERFPVADRWAKMEEYLDLTPFGDEHFRLIIHNQKLLVFVPLDTGGWDIADPRIRVALDELFGRLPKNQWVLTFRVCNDSFPCYLDVRSLADQKGYDSGWTPHTVPFYVSVSLDSSQGGPGGAAPID